MKNDAALLFALDRGTSLLLLNDSGSLSQSVSGEKRHRIVLPRATAAANNNKLKGLWSTTRVRGKKTYFIRRHSLWFDDKSLAPRMQIFE